MAEEHNTPENDNQEQVQSPDEFALLKDRARLMGLKFSNNISLEGLRKKVNDALENVNKQDASDNDDTDVDPADLPVNPLTIPAAPEKASQAAKPAKLSLRQYLQREQLKLIRVRITNMDPKKKDLPGEVLSVANEYIGTIKKYVPFGEQSENGYHIPKVIYDLLESRRFQNVRVTKDPVTKQTRVDTSWAREFSLEILEPLTKKELHDLAIAQQAAGNS